MVAMVGDADAEPAMQMLEGFRLYPLMVDLRFNRADAILAAAQPSASRALSRAFWRYARGIAFASQGKGREAVAEQRRFERDRQAVPAESQYLLNNKSADLLALAAATLAARIAEAQGNAEQAIAEWRRAVELEARIQYDEPPAWFYPLRQSLGGALLRGGQAREAEAVFREALAKHPRDGRLLFGLWQSLLVLDRDAEAGLVEAQFREAWKGATVPLSREDL
jgi:tetratricopeptide (TPR) repeat protein